MGHLLSHKKEQSQIAFVGTAEEAAELCQHSGIFSFAAPYDVVGRLALREIWQGWRLFSLVEKLVHRNFKGSSHFLKRFYSRNCVSVLDAGNIATEQSRSLLDIALRKLLFLT